jgi:hypothetical protein
MLLSFLSESHNTALVSILVAVSRTSLKAKISFYPAFVTLHVASSKIHVEIDE